MAKVAELTMVRKKLSDVKPNPKNPRVHSPEQLDKLEKSLETYGYSKGSMVVNTDGYLLAGHGIYESFREKGYSEADFIEVDLPEGLAEAFMVADNRLGELSTWDDGRLNALFAELQEMPDVDLEDTGFELEEIADYMGSSEVTEDDFDVDAALEEEPVTQVGDLWLLGEHRLLCGDSTKAEDVERVMGGEKADMVFSDPPYGVDLNTNFADIIQGGIHKIDGGKPRNLYNYDKIVGDAGDFDYGCVKNICGLAKECFLWGAEYYIENLPNFGCNGSWIVWDKKPKGEMAESFGNQFELCWSQQKHKRIIIEYTYAGVLGMKPNDGNRMHPTQKPVDLTCQIITRWGKGCNIIIDPFLGSGTTLIACQELGRKCIAMEISPRYCDVTVKRYINHVGTDEDVFVERDGKRLHWSEVSDGGT